MCRTEIVAPVFGQHSVGGLPIERFPGDGEVHVSQVLHVAAAFPGATDHCPRRPAGQSFAWAARLPLQRQWIGHPAGAVATLRWGGPGASSALLTALQVELEGAVDPDGSPGSRQSKRPLRCRPRPSPMATVSCWLDPHPAHLGQAGGLEVEGTGDRPLGELDLQGQGIEQHAPGGLARSLAAPSTSSSPSARAMQAGPSGGSEDAPGGLGRSGQHGG